MIKRVIDVDLEIIEELVADYIEDTETIVALVGKNPKVVTRLITDSYHALSSKYLISGWDDDTSKIFSLLKDFAIAHFRQAMSPDQQVEFKIGHTSYNVTRERFNQGTDAYNWVKCFHIAILSRDQESIDHLRKVPTLVFETAEIRPDQFALNRVRFMKGLFDPDVNIAQLLVDVIESTNLENFESHQIEGIRDIAQPILFVYGEILRRDQEQFNLALTEALELHKTFWSRGKDEMGHDVERWLDYQGWISLALSAACVIAVDNGLELQVESDFLLKELILSKQKF